MTNTETDKHLGDARVLEAARYQIREGFREKSLLSPSDPAVLPAIQHAEEVASFLRSNLVQGRKDGETYSKAAQAVYGSQLLTYITTTELRIHKDTERGDNDTIKLGNGQTVTIDGKTCKDR